MKKVAVVIDLASMDTVKGANEGFDGPIVHPATGEALGIVIHVLGKDSDEFQRKSREQSKKRLAKMSKGGFRSSQITAEEIEQDGLDLLACCTTGWKQGEKPTLTLGGKEIEFTAANVVMVYERFPWIREQVDVAIGDRANFIKA